VDKVGELGGITNEKHWSIIENPIQNTLLSTELDSETTGVPSNVCRPLLTAYGREAYGDGSLLANALEDISHTVSLGYRVSNFEITMSAGTFGVDHTLRDTFTVKVSKRLDQVPILQEKRAAVSDSLSLVGIGVRDTVSSCVLELLWGLSRCAVLKLGARE